MSRINSAGKGKNAIR